MGLPKGLITRVLAMLMGIVGIAIVVDVINLSSDDAGFVVLLYVFAAAIYFAYFLVKHEHEIPTRSDRR
jgi:hypothetical protein